MRILPKILISLILALAPCVAQKAMFFGQNVVIAGGGGSVTVSNSTIPAACADGSASCSYASVSMSSGSTYVVYVAYCTSSSCSTGDFTTVSVSDGTNTYTEVAAAAVITNEWTVKAFVATNVTSGTYTITISKTGSGTFYYTTTALIELAGGNLSSPVDSSVSNQTGGLSSSTPSLTSSGNVSASGEMALAYMFCKFTMSSVTGSFSTLQTIGTTAALANLANPSPGAPITASAACSSGQYWFSLIAVQP